MQSQSYFLAFTSGKLFQVSRANRDIRRLPWIRQASCRCPEKDGRHPVCAIRFIFRCRSTPWVNFFFRVTPVLEDWEVEKLRQFINKLHIGYSKLYDATNGLYLHVNDRGQLQSTPKDSDAPEMFWTRSGDKCIENYFTGKLRFLNLHCLQCLWRVVQE